MYLYDENGMIGLMYGYNTSTLQPYYYQRNIFGDVIAIRDKNGNKVAEYAYDAWGNCTIVSGANTTLANYNPIRYRGYYYDRETKLYYCNARYYDPEWRRFISHDDSAYLDPETPNGLNLYAYCYNDPVNYADPSGHSVMLGLIGLGIGVFCGLGYGAYKDYKDDREINGSVGWQTYLASSLMLGAIGFAFGYFWPLISSFLGSSFSFTLPSAEAIIAGEALALAEGIIITVTGAQIAGGVIATNLGIMLFSKSAQRYKHKDPRSNKSQNKEIDHLQQKYDFNDDFRRRLQDKITKRGYDKAKIEQIIRKMLGLDV